MSEGLSTINGPIPPYHMFLQTSDYRMSPTPRENTSCEGPSKLTGPIQCDYSHNRNEDHITNQLNNFSLEVPRVRNDGKKNFLAHKNGNGVGLLIEMQGRAITPRAFKFREKPKNHMNSNCTKIKQLMRKVKEREASKQVPVKPLWKSEKYKDVQSKLKEILQDEPLAPRDVNKTFLRAHSRTGSASARRPQSARQIPTEYEKLEHDHQFKSKDDIDFVKLNQRLAAKVTMKRAPSAEMLQKFSEKKNNQFLEYEEKIKGKVPDYLKKRRDVWEQEQLNIIKNTPDPDQPPGHRKLPEDERLKTLAMLTETQNKLISQMNALPIRNDTFRLQTHKSDFEKRLCEIDEAIKIFSRNKVFVKIDE